MAGMKSLGISAQKFLQFTSLLNLENKIYWQNNFFACTTCWIWKWTLAWYRTSIPSKGCRQTYKETKKWQNNNMQKWKLQYQLKHTPNAILAAIFCPHSLTTTNSACLHVVQSLLPAVSHIQVSKKLLSVMEPKGSSLGLQNFWS